MSIAIDRVIQKLDEHLNRNDLAAAERLLSYWRAEAEVSDDERARLTLLNEQTGLYRKLGKEKDCLAAVEAVLSFPEVWAAAQGRDATQSENKEKNSKADFSISDATTLVNAATGLKAFGRAKEALPLYEAAKRIYEQAFLPRNAAENGRAEQSTDPRLAGLYNNMALCLMDLGDFDRAEELFQKAMSVMALTDQGEAEMAVTCCNLADLYAKRSGLFGSMQEEKIPAAEEAIGDPAEQAVKAIEGFMERAEALLDSAALKHDGHYAFVCEKCAPVFGCYGYFAAEKKYAELAKSIYAANGQDAVRE